MVSSRLFWLSLRAVSEWVTLLSSSSKISMIAGHRFSLFCRNLDCQKDDVWSYESVQSNVNNVIDFWCVMSQNNTFILTSYDKNKQWYPANAIWRIGRNIPVTFALFIDDDKVVDFSQVLITVAFLCQGIVWLNSRKCGLIEKECLTLEFRLN